MKTSHIKPGFCLSGMVFLIFFFMGFFQPAFAQTVKFGHVAPPFHGQAKGVDAFADYVKEKTHGDIDIATFPAGQLGGERSLAEQVQAGTLEMAAVATAVLQNFVPQCSILDMPFLFPNRQTLYATIDDPEVQERIFSYFPKKGFIAIGWTENEFRDFSNNKRPVRTPDDIKGLKVRVMNSPTYLDTFRQLGASPVAIPFPETYNALQTGVIDAQENPLITSILMKFTEVTQYVTRTQHCVTECVIIVSVDYWESLTQAQQQIFKDAARQSIQINRTVTAALHESLPKLNMSVEAYARANNIEIIDLSEQEREMFRKAMTPVWDKYRKKIGNDLFDFVLEKIETHGM
ncbi:MAG: DctP family TRAP transporter solute-binding subunit [Desulfotignum balticum]|jgi:tripartite ATP-independent transporter DctP family solute receptor|uniref:DctP family TRAP transporter solute-binding subunit n=1 Tax=Desulfotignum balticum TaxID=115781 RepID=A0A931CS93_9BACT|nr:DctP family TRAP transporter solute-binding subunit [Desulfotignum balticum]